MADESLKRTMNQMFQANDRNRQSIERSVGREIGYPVVSEWPTGVSDGFIVFNVYSRRLHMYNGSTWISMGDVGAYIALIAAIVYLRGAWSMSSIGETAAVYDSSNQGRTLSNANVSFGLINGFVPYGVFNGTTGYLARTDEAGLDITGALTIGCWIKLGATGSQVIIGKFGAAGQYTYEIAYISGTGFRFQMSTNGTTIVSVTSTDPSPGTTNWYHIVGRFDPSTEIAIFVNGVKYGFSTAIPATIFSGTANFAIGRRSDGTFYTTASISMAFLVAVVLTTAYIGAIYEEGIPLFT